MKIQNYILNSPTDIEKCDSNKYWDWHQRQNEDDQTVLGIRLRYVELENGIIISTVFTGDDQLGFEKGEPVLFETIVYDPDSIYNIIKRYTDHDKAVKNHERIEAQIRDVCKIGCSI